VEGPETRAFEERGISLTKQEGRGDPKGKNKYSREAPQGGGGTSDVSRRCAHKGRRQAGRRGRQDYHRRPNPPQKAQTSRSDLRTPEYRGGEYHVKRVRYFSAKIRRIQLSRQVVSARKQDWPSRNGIVRAPDLSIGNSRPGLGNRSSEASPAEGGGGGGGGRWVMGSRLCQ